MRGEQELVARSARDVTPNESPSAPPVTAVAALPPLPAPPEIAARPPSS